MADRLAEIEKRAAATYPGPWFWNSYSGIFSGTCKRTGRHDVSSQGFNGCPITDNHDDECTPIIAWVPASHGDTAGPQDGANADFIACSRDDVPWLIEEVKRLRATLRTIRDVVDRQAEDEGLWFVSETAAEAYVQQQLRALHTDIERHTCALAST